MIIVFSCLGSVSCVRNWVVWFCLLVCKASDWLGRLYSRDIFRVEGFPLQRPDRRVVYLMSF